MKHDFVFVNSVKFTEASIILQTPEAGGAQGLGSQGLHLEVVNSTPFFYIW